MGMQRSGTNRVPLIIAAIVGVVLIFTLRQCFSDGRPTNSARDVADQAQAPRRDCVGLSVVGSSEKAALMSEIAAAYERTDPQVGSRCVDVQVTSKASGGAAEALGRGWDDAIDGTRPDVWSPASSSWVVLLEQRLAARDAPNIVPKELPSIAKTPLVIAMPRPMAEVLGWPDKPIGWGDVLSISQDPSGWGKLGHPEWGKFRLGKTNPNFSTSGFNATIGAYFAATGRSSDLTEADINDPKVQEFVRGVESAVVHYGDTTLTFLTNMQAADDRGAGLTYISAATVEEKSVWDYNKGNPDGDPKTLGKHDPPKVPLVAVYPKEGTLFSDNPYTVLNAPWVNAQKKQAAAGFLKFLQERAQQRRFQEAAFRDYNGKAGKEITLKNGLIPAGPANEISPPAPAVLDKVQRSWADLRKRARVLMIIDVSGSMGQPVPKSGETKLELAKRAAANSLVQFAPNDELGLWIFSTNLQGTKPYLELVPMGPVGTNLDPVRQKIAGLTPNGGTALYATGRAGVQAMRKGFDTTRINAIVLLTDGKNEYPEEPNVEPLLKELQSESEDTAVRLFPIAYGEDADLSILKRIAEASRAAAYDASDPASIDKVFTAVISNF